jgi:hypothetical protein
METSYIYSIENDFKNATQVDLSHLQNQINSNSTISVNVNYINRSNNTVTIFFPLALSEPQKNVLDDLIASYTYIAVSSAYSYINESEASTTNNTFVVIDTFSTGSFLSGNWKLVWYFEYQCEKINQIFESQIVRIDVADTPSHCSIKGDSSDTWRVNSGFKYYILDNESPVFNIQLLNRTKGITSKIRKRRLEFLRV